MAEHANVEAIRGGYEAFVIGRSWTGCRGSACAC